MKTNSRTHTPPPRTRTMTLRLSLGPNLCVFASLREPLYSLVAVRPPCDSVVKIGLIYVNL